MRTAPIPFPETSHSIVKGLEKSGNAKTGGLRHGLFQILKGFRGILYPLKGVPFQHGGEGCFYNTIIADKLSVITS